MAGEGGPTMSTNFLDHMKMIEAIPKDFVCNTR